jgi:hypothetical protein
MIKKMNKHTKEAALLFLLLLAALPCQQLLIRQLKKYLPSAAVRNDAAPAEEFSESALSGNALGIIRMAEFNFKRGEYAVGEAWLKFGAMQQRSPSVLLYYGDWITHKKRFRQAEYLYRYALKRARQNNAPQAFISALEKRLEGRR